MDPIDRPTPEGILDFLAGKCRLEMPAGEEDALLPGLAPHQMGQKGHSEEIFGKKYEKII